MSDVTETLQQLMERRLREMGKRRGRGESISLREAWMRLPEHDGKRAVSYETVRRIRENGHTTIGDATADALATMLDVPVAQILMAAGQRPRLGRFELPQRADRLTPPERATILSMVDALLDATDRGRQEGVVLAQLTKDNVHDVVRALNTKGPGPLPDAYLEDLQAAARRGRRQRSITDQQQNAAGQENQDSGGSDPA